MKTRMAREVKIYVLVLNVFGNTLGERVAISDDYDRLVNWYNKQLNPDGVYRDGMWNKTFKKGSFIEFCNPCDSLKLNDTSIFGFGIHDEWIPMEVFNNLRNRGYNVV